MSENFKFWLVGLFLSFAKLFQPTMVENVLIDILRAENDRMKQRFLTFHTGKEKAQKMIRRVEESAFTEPAKITPILNYVSRITAFSEQVLVHVRKMDKFLQGIANRSLVCPERLYTFRVDNDYFERTLVGEEIELRKRIQPLRRMVN